MNFLQLCIIRRFERYSEQGLLLHRLIVYPSVAIRPIIIILITLFVQKLLRA